MARAEEAKGRAEESLQEQRDVTDFVQTDAALRRALARLRVAERRGRRGRSGPPRV